MKSNYKKIKSFFATLIVLFIVVVAARNDSSNQDKIKLKEINRLKLEQIKNQKYHPQITALGRYAIETTALSAIVVDNDTGEVLFEKNAHLPLPPASIAKMLTALVAAEEMDLESRLTVSKEASEMIPNKVYLYEGEKIRLEDLLYGLMMASGNDAAEVIAENFPGGRDKFIEALNNKIKSLGLKNTVFKNPSGLDEDGFVSTAYDMATITRYAIKNKPEILKWAGTREYMINEKEGLNYPHYIKHISELLPAYPYMIASKPGFTYGAGRTLIGVAEKDNKKVILVYLNCNNGLTEGPKLFNYGFYKLGV